MWPNIAVTILTTTPNTEMAALHDRMPVILEQQDWPVWLGEAEGDHAALLRLHRTGCCVCGRWIGRRLTAQQRAGAAGAHCRVGRHDLPRTSGTLFRARHKGRYGKSALWGRCPGSDMPTSPSKNEEAPQWLTKSISAF
jgi:hypothetical protein